MSTHTPGPWVIAGHGAVSAAGRKSPLAHVDGRLGASECRANTALIAAAPDLLRALKFARDLLRDDLDYRPDDEAANAFSQIGEAIQKAEGK